MSTPDQPVAIIGAGPVGLFTGLVLAQSGVKVIIHELGAGIDQSPRAIAYFPPVLEEFGKAGIVADIIAAGEKVLDGCDWRDASRGTVLAGINPPPDQPTFAVVLSQPELGAILLEKLLGTGNAEVIFNERFVRLEQSADDGVRYWTSRVGSDGAKGEEVERRCTYLVGADGGRSAVRKFLGIKLEGFTFEEFQFVAVNFEYPLHELGWKTANYMVDPEDWGVIVKRGKGTRWRFATAVRKSIVGADADAGLSEAAVQVVKERMKRILPGDTSQLRYEGMAPYTVHQRCASRYSDGRVFLAGDAAHLNNPVGGLGLTTGLLDAAHLTKALKQVLHDGANTSVLTSYADTRRRIFLERTNPITTASIRGLYSQDAAEVKRREDNFARLNNPADFMSAVRIGLPDFSLTSTSDRIFDTQTEVTWFISVTKLADWTTEKFQHEYKTVHADMVRYTHGRPQPVTRYIQLSNSASAAATVEGTERVSWDYATCISMPSLFIVHAGFADPGYKKTAGAHIFCSLKQHGCLTTQVAKYSKGKREDGSDVGAIQCLIFHRRSDDADDYAESWFDERAATWKGVEAGDARLRTYVLWRDVTPRDTDYFFRDTQFAEGSWREYKAVEAFHFEDEAASVAFLEEYKKRIGGDLVEKRQTIVGVPDIIV